MGIRDSLTLPLILSASKYFRNVFNWAPHFISIQILQKHFLGTKCTVLNWKEAGKGSSWMFVRVSNIFPRNYCANIWKKIFVILKVWFHHEGGLSQSCYFELFFSTRYEAPPHKKSAFTEPPFLLFLTFGLISSNFVF